MAPVVDGAKIDIMLRRLRLLKRLKWLKWLKWLKRFGD